MKIDQKIFVVTGAARGLRQAIAAKLLALVGWDEKAVQACQQQINPAGDQSRAYAIDVSQEEAVRTLFKRIEADLGRVTGLINNAGILRDGLVVKAKDGEIISQMSLQQWQRVIDVNLTGVFLCGREAATRMIEHQKPGLIINISSISRAGNPGQSNYAAAKAGVAAITVTWAKELARYGIRVAGIAPGIFATDMVKQMPEHMREKLEGQIPLRRSGTLDELADAVLPVLQRLFYRPLTGA